MLLKNLAAGAALCDVHTRQGKGIGLRGASGKRHRVPKWRFPERGGSPKWIVYNGKSYLNG